MKAASKLPVDVWPIFSFQVDGIRPRLAPRPNSELLVRDVLVGYDAGFCVAVVYPACRELYRGSKVIHTQTSVTRWQASNT